MTTHNIDLTPTTKGYIKILKAIIDTTPKEDDRKWCIEELKRIDEENKQIDFDIKIKQTRSYTNLDACDTDSQTSNTKGEV